MKKTECAIAIVGVMPFCKQEWIHSCVIVARYRYTIVYRATVAWRHYPTDNRIGRIWRYTGATVNTIAVDRITDEHQHDVIYTICWRMMQTQCDDYLSKKSKNRRKRY